MMKIEDILEDYFKKVYGKDGNYKDLINNNIKILKDAFLAGYQQAIEDRIKLEGGLFV